MTATSTSAEIVWLLATAPEPMTAAEVSEWFDDTTHSNISTLLCRLSYAGLAERQKTGKPGRPFEYWLAGREGVTL